MDKIALLHISEFNNEWNRHALDLAQNERAAIRRGPEAPNQPTGPVSESNREPVARPDPAIERATEAKIAKR